MTHGAVSPSIPLRASTSTQDKISDSTALSALYAPTTMLIVAGAFALRLVLLHRYPFREDEAAYAYWALHGWFEDPMFLQVWPDKPPIFLWLLGAAFRLFGVSEASARWVNVAASTLTVPIVAATARRLWGGRAALVAAAAMAFSPYAISFAPTAYTDPVLVLAGLSAFCAAVYGRPLVAGLLLGVAIMTKQQGVLFSPLIIAALCVTQASTASSTRRWIRCAGLFAGGLSVIVLPIVYWDSLRWAVAPSPWDLGVRNYDAVTLLSPAEWPARFGLWAPLLFDLTASWAVWTMWIGLVVVATLIALLRPGNVAGLLRSNMAILLIAGWSLCFLAVHIVSTVQPWDRYLLPLAPMLVLMAAWAVGRIGAKAPNTPMVALAVLGFLLLANPGQRAAAGELATGADHGDYAGLTDAIRAVQGSNNGPRILYHRELGTQYRFYLNDRAAGAAQDEQIELRWFPSTIYLADNAAKTPYPPKFVVIPDWAPLPNLATHLSMRGLSSRKVGRYGRFTVWEILGDTAGRCTWCLSRPVAPWPEMTGATSDSTYGQP